MIDLSAATPTLRERLLSKIVQAGPATPCATWVGAYNVDGRRAKRNRGQRPVIQLGRIGSPVVYVTRVLLALADDRATVIVGAEACHRGCPCGPPVDDRYRCVDVDHLRQGTRAENEADKYAR
jgi:hypothetical protein